VSEWWRSFFTGRWFDVQLDWAAIVTDDEIDDLERHLRLEPGSDVLDVPCGEGRIARALARRGHRVTGVDITEAFLDEARRRAEAEDLAVRWEHGDMRNLAFEGAFDAAVNYWGSFGYFDEDGDRAVAAGVARALRPGGRFLIEALSTETLLPGFAQRLWQRVGHTLVLNENRFDHERSRVESEWTFIGPNGERDVRDSSIRLYSYVELTSLLRDVGFDAFDAYDTTSGEPFGLGADRLTLIATKPS
jgi:SAM-dependent methyltransferase